MKYKIIWTAVAKEDYANLLEYLENNYNTNTAVKFLDKVESIIERIATFPLMYPAIPKRKNIRRAVITKQISLVYSIHEKEIWLIELYDNRSL